MSKEKGFQDKLKNFFKGLNKGTHVARSRSEDYVILTEEVESELSAETSPLATRIRAIKDINEVAKQRRLENFATEKLWTLLQDLLKPDVPKETRHLVLALFTTLCQTQVEKNGYLRAEFFGFIKTHNVEEDAGPKFEFLKALTDNGRDVSYFDEKLGPLILAWMGGSHHANNVINIHNRKTGEFMVFLNNFLKFNQSFVDQEVLASIVQNVCFVACTAQARTDTLECIHVLETVICYGSLPTNSLSTFLATLCRTVNIEFLCQASWKTVRNLLGTHLGHSGLLTMCKFMETADRNEDYSVIRGAVFFVGVSLWGSKMVRSLKYTPSTVLSSFQSALEKKHIYISYEVLLRIQDLVKHSGENLQSITWDLILDIVGTIVDDTRGGEWKNDPVNYNKLLKLINDTLDAIENIVDSGAFAGARHSFFDVIESATAFRPESSIEKLMMYKQRNFLYCTKANWLNNLHVFAERNLREESRPNLKVKAVKIIHQVAISQLQTHEDELIDRIILHYFKSLELEQSIQVRQAGVEFLVEFLLESTSKKCYEVVGILEKIVNRPYESPGSVASHQEMLHESDAMDIITAISGLIQLFQKKIYHLPSSVPIYCYRILVRHLSHHYKRINLLDHCGSIRYNIFHCFFKIRANSLYHLGFPRELDSHSSGVSSGISSVTGAGGMGIRYSPYLAVDHRDGERPDCSSSANSGDSPIIIGNSNNPATASAIAAVVPGPQTLTSPVVTSVSLTLACKLVVKCLKIEKDWKILELVLKQIPFVLENKALVLSKHGNDIDYLATALCAMVTDKSVAIEILRNAPQKFTRSEFQGYIFPILTSLVSYHTHLEPSVQLKIVKCLEIGLVTKCTRICILSLSICSLEMKDTMHKLLPEVLLSLSKITPKVNIAIPVLEFLSTLIHLPRIFASFVHDQYMSIFAIALPYTNPFKFNQYTVSLAHHVIAMWFLKCRLSFRRGFVKYIIKGLESNVWAPFEEAANHQKRPELHNEDSSNRKRSSSLTDQTYKRRERPISGHQIPGGGGTNQQQGPSGRFPPGGGGVGGLDWKLPMDQNQTKTLSSFHQELSETCVDLMARYTFADCSALPTRFQSTNFLLNSGGHSQTWLSENKIITITTSGCTQKELRDGLCDKCYRACRKFSTGEDPSTTNTTTGAVVSSNNNFNNSGERFPDMDPANSSILSSQQSSTNPAQQRISLPGIPEHNSTRRRHRSAFAGTTVGKLSRPDSLLEDPITFPGSTSSSSSSSAAALIKSRDDLHLENRKELEESIFSSTDLALKTKSEHAHCTCWCQGWAEVHIRRPTGNTSWMMRVQNELGNHNGFEFPIKELSALYMNTMFNLRSLPSSSAEASAQSSPSHKISSHNPTIGGNHQDSGDRVATPESPLSPKSSGSPIEDYCAAQGLENGKKNPVRRSNSSPEMCSSWKAPFLNQQREIQEQDEEESATMTALPPVATSPAQLESNAESTTNTKHVGASNNVNGVGGHPQQSNSGDINNSVGGIWCGSSAGGNASGSSAVGILSGSSASGIVSTSSSVGGSSAGGISGGNSAGGISGGSSAGGNSSVNANDDSSSINNSTKIENPDVEKSIASKPPPLCSSLAASFLPCDTIPEEIPPVSSSPLNFLERRNSLLEEQLNPMRRDRLSTISVMSPARRNTGTNLRRMLSSDSSMMGRGTTSSGTNSNNGESGIRSGISPGFIFMQLCAQGMFGGSGPGTTGTNYNKPILFPNNEATKKSLKVLDYIPPYETHKIGVVYVGPGQVTQESKILQNKYGSSRYREFLNGLGKLIKLTQVDPQKTFLGGLSRDGNDGEFATIWQDDVMQVIFHVATLMPNNLATDPSCNSKKCHIGNDFVAIVYNNSGEEYDISTIKCQFLYACVVIEPLDHRTNRVIVKAKPVLADLIGHTEPKIVSDQNLPIMARQWALHSNLASLIFQSMQRPGADPYASNWLERLRHIKRLRSRMTQEGGGNVQKPAAEVSSSAAANTSSSSLSSVAAVGSRRSFNVDDFTEYV